MGNDSLDLLFRGRPEEVAQTVSTVFEGLVSRLADSMPGAVLGNADEIHCFVTSYVQLVRGILKSAHAIDPDLVLSRGANLLLVDAKGTPSELVTDILDQGALQAPFSPWVGKFGPGAGTAVFAVSEVRRYLRFGPFELPEDWAVFPNLDISRRDYSRFARRAWAELERGRQDPLKHIMETFGLTKTETARLFGVRRQALDTWEAKGVPSARQEKVAAADALANVLEQKLKTTRIPAVVRRPAAAFEGRSILEMIAEGRHLEVLDDTRSRFEWASTA